MSYTKTQWNNDTAPAINETNLNKIEQGIYDNDSAITTINANIGDLSDLETTTQTDIVGAINENVDNIGDLTTLTPTANTDLVSAINEVDSHADTNSTNIGDLTTLTTTAKSNVVSAVNELDSLKATKDVATTSNNGLMSASDKENLDKGTRTQVLWSGSKYSLNDTMELSETIILGKLYMVEFFAKSGGFKSQYIFRGEFYAAQKTQVCQINYYSVPDEAGFRYRIETTDGKKLKISDATNTASNTAITAIYKII